MMNRFIVQRQTRTADSDVEGRQIDQDIAESLKALNEGRIVNSDDMISRLKQKYEAAFGGPKLTLR